LLLVELQSVRKNDAYKLQDIARAIKNGQNTKDIEFRANGKVVSKDQYGKGDLQEAQDQAAFYNEMVCKGAWPDYENRKPTCE
jgi:hypothetical protein